MKVIGQKPSAPTQDVKSAQMQSKEKVSDAHKNIDHLGKNDSVKTSSFTLDKIKNKITAEPTVRTDRVAELKAKIKSGEYKVDTQALAGKMLIDTLREDIA